MVLVADVHLGIKNDDEVFIAQTKKLFESIIEFCIKNNDYEIAILGDFFDNKKNLGAYSSEASIEIMDLLRNSNIKTHIVIGNHDIYYDDKTFLKIFKEYDNINIITDTYVKDDIGFSSWKKDINLPVKYLLGHFAINGFPVTKNFLFEKSNLSSSTLKKYDLVISGHFHLPSKKDNIVYLGSPYHLTFNDTNSERGFYHFIDGKLNFIKFNGIEFIEFNQNEIIDEKVSGNIVKIIITENIGDTNIQKVIDHVNSLNPLRLYTKISFSSIIDIKDRENKEIEIKSNMDIFNDFIKITESPNHINQKILLSMVKELMENNNGNC